MSEKEYLLTRKYHLTTEGPQGNAYAIMGYVTTAMEQERSLINWGDNSVFKMEKEHYLNDAMSSDYKHLVQVSQQMINRINQRIEQHIKEAEDENKN